MLNGRVARTEFTLLLRRLHGRRDVPRGPRRGDVASPYHNWSTVVSRPTVSSAFGVGTLQSITVLSRNGLGADGGRVTKVRVTGRPAHGRRLRQRVPQRRSACARTGSRSPASRRQPIYSGDPTNINLSPSSVSAVRTGAASVIAFVRGMDNALWSAVPSTACSTRSRRSPAGRCRPGQRQLGRQPDRPVRRRRQFGADAHLDDGRRHRSADHVGPVRVARRGPDLRAGGGLQRVGQPDRHRPGPVRGTAYRTYTGGTWSPWKSAGGASVVAPQAEVYDGGIPAPRRGPRRRRLDAAGALNGADATADWVSTGRASTLAPTVSGTTWWARDVRAAAWPNGQNGIRQDREATSTSVDLGGGPPPRWRWWSSGRPLLDLHPRARQRPLAEHRHPERWE